MIDTLLFSNSSDTFKIYDSSGVVSIDKIRNDVTETRKILLDLKVNPYENIAIICDNHSCFLSALMSIVSVGAVAVPIDPQVSGAALREIFKKFNIRSVFIYGKRAEETLIHQELCDYLIQYDGSKWNLIRAVEPKNNDRKLISYENGPKPAIILLTSGTADLMHKGVLLSNEGILNNIESIIDYMQPKSSESLYIAKSMSHISSVVGELLMALKVGMTVYAYNPVVAYSVQIKRLLECNPDYLVVNPTLLHYLIRYAEKEQVKPKMQAIYTCGGYAGAKLITKARNVFEPTKVYNMYGLSEAGPRVTAQSNDLNNYKAGYAGKAVKNVLIKIVGDNGEANTNEEGRIFIKSNALMIGYYGDTELTNEKIKDGWLSTGDIGYLNEYNELYVSGRADDVVIRSGKNVNLNIVEGCINEIESIKECVVFSIPDNINQNKIICAYTRNENLYVDANKIREYCLKKLFPYECPQQIVEWETIPKTNSNKKSRKRAAEIYLKLINNNGDID